MCKRAAVCFILLVALVLGCLSVSGCTPSVNDFTVTFAKTVYEVDEEFHFEGAKLFVSFSDGTKRYVNLTKEMLRNFDTALSGEKEAIVRYKNKTKTVSYSVTGEIRTRTRLVADSGTGSECVVYLKNIEFPISALSFKLTGKDVPEALTLLKEDWKIVTRTIENGVSVILYTDIGQPISDNTALFNFLCGADAELVFSKIIIATKDAEYVLPDAERIAAVVTNAKTW